MEKSDEVSSNICLVCEGTLPLHTDSELCSTCDKNLEDSAYVFCMKCLTLWSFLDPGPMKYGKSIDPGGTYHTDHCVGCRPDQIEFKIKEIEDFTKCFN
jgi:hypothetical protein